MAIIQSCCCFNTLKTGCYASAIFTLVFFGLWTMMLLSVIYEEKDFLFGKLHKPRGMSILERDGVTLTTVIFYLLFLICSIYMVISAILLILALRSDHRRLLLPWIISMACNILIELCYLFYLAWSSRVIFDPAAGFIFTMDFFIMCLNVYCWVCVYSQYQLYTEQRAVHSEQE